VKKKEKFTAEALVLAILHFFTTVLLFWVAAVPPLWVAVVGLIIEQLQIKLLGNCILTKLAHIKGYMIGMSYWEYVPYMLGIKDYKTAKKIIDYSIKVGLVTIILVRIGSGVYFWYLSR